MAVVAAFAPFLAQAGGDPVGQEADADMVADAVGARMKDRTHFQIAFELAKGLLNFKEVFIVVEDLLRGGLLL